jgi:hypothetical protein
MVAAAASTLVEETAQPATLTMQPTNLTKVPTVVLTTTALEAVGSSRQREAEKRTPYVGRWDEARASRETAVVSKQRGLSMIRTMAMWRL